MTPSFLIPLRRVINPQFRLFPSPHFCLKLKLTGVKSLVKGENYCGSTAISTNNDFNRFYGKLGINLLRTTNLTTKNFWQCLREIYMFPTLLSL